MNKPFGPAPIVQEMLAGACVSISDLKRNPAAVIAEARLRQVAILNRNKPVAYMISPEAWEGILDLIDDAQDAEVVAERLRAPGTMVEVSIDDL